MLRTASPFFLKIFQTYQNYVQKSKFKVKKISLFNVFFYRIKKGSIKLKMDNCVSYHRLII